MKTELKIPESKPELKFPLLATSKNYGQTVLFFSHKSGGVVVASHHFNVGVYSTEWMSVFDADFWTIHPPGTQLILTVE